MSLDAAQKKLVAGIFHQLERENGNVSTEQLFARTCEQAAHVLGFAIDDGDLAEALYDLRTP